ncbi:MAG TPA: GNAT family N-acetyltransferase [Burkholderiales bacterium]|nr:GNAT family N-acetyltransferase [Burkholderiales bacterium]
MNLNPGEMAFAALAPDAPAASLVGARALEVATLTTEEAFVALAVDWNRVHGECGTASIFNSWFWQYTWWQVYGGGRPLRILVASEGDTLVGILPLHLRTVQALGRTVRVLQFIGTGGDTHPDDLGAILLPRCKEAAAEALAEAVLSLSGWDVLALGDMDPRSPFPEALERAAARRGLAREKGVSQRIPYVTLPSSWNAFLASLDAKRRARFRKFPRRLAEAFPARFFVWDDAARLDEAVDRLAHLHRKRWSEYGVSTSFATAEYVEFHRRVIKGCFPRGWLRLYCLEIAGEVAAMLYCYRFRNGIYAMQTGFDPGYAQYAAGTVLLGRAIEHAIGEGNRVYDFLRGRHRYKDEVATASRSTVFVHAYRPTLAGAAYRLRHLRWPAWKRRLAALRPKRRAWGG